MKSEWEILGLGGYLKPTHLGQKYTFTVTFEATEELPKVAVGLGMIDTNRQGYSSLELVPAIKHTRSPMMNTFINEVAELYLQYSDETPDLWQQRILLDLGYTSLAQTRSKLATDYILFDGIPPQHRLPLLQKYGFHKVATAVAYGFAENVEDVITTIDNLNRELPEGANYSTVITLVRMGVPMEELAVAAQLPLDMVEEIYGESITPPSHGRGLDVY